MSFVPLERLPLAPAPARHPTAEPRLLKRFDRPEAAMGPERAGATEEPAPEPSTGPLEAEEPPPDPDPAPGREATGTQAAEAAFEAARADLLARLAGLVARAEAERAAALETQKAAFAEAFAAAAAAAVPHLAATAFPAEIAAVARAAAAALPDRCPEVRLSPDDLTALAPLLDEALPLRLAGDPALAPGEVRLAWDAGGLDLDRDRLTAAALERLAIHLTRPEPGDRDP